MQHANDNIGDTPRHANFVTASEVEEALKGFTLGASHPPTRPMAAFDLWSEAEGEDIDDRLLWDHADDAALRWICANGGPEAIPATELRRVLGCEFEHWRNALGWVHVVTGGA